MQIHADGERFDIMFDEYDDQEVMTPYSDGDDTEFCVMIGQATLSGVDVQTLADLANKIYKLFGKEFPKGE